MADILFLGTGSEVLPFRLLGLDTLDAGQADVTAWEEAAAGHPLVMVAESVARNHPEKLDHLRDFLRDRSALTIVPHPGSPDDLHRRHLRELTIRAMGVDTWAAHSTATEDSNR